MNLLFLYLGISVLIIITLFIIGIVIYNNFQDVIIRINEVESAIDNLIRAKYDSINQAISIIKGTVNIEKEILEEIVKLRSRKIGNFELDRKLIEANHELISLRKEYPELNNSEEIEKIIKTSTKNDEKLTSLKEYYDNNIAKYNKLVRSFPTNIISSIFKYKEKLFFDKKDMTDDDDKDFKL